jgi:hypothetical protein
MSEVKMKTVNVCWSEKVFRLTTMEVPEDFTDSEIEQAFWEMDLSDEPIVDTEFAYVEDISRVYSNEELTSQE